MKSLPGTVQAHTALSLAIALSLLVTGCAGSAGETNTMRDYELSDSVAVQLVDRASLTLEAEHDDLTILSGTMAGSSDDRCILIVSDKENLLEGCSAGSQLTFHANRISVKYSVEPGVLKDDGDWVALSPQVLLLDQRQ